jgi:RNA-directed DNA polymerase
MVGWARSGEKTRRAHLEAGCDFRGQNRRTYYGTLRIHPAKEGVHKRLDNRRGSLHRRPTAKPAPASRQMKPVLRGGAHGHRHVGRTKSFAAVDVQLARAIGRWATRRPPNQDTTRMKPRGWPSRGAKPGGGTGQEAHGPTIDLRTTAATPIQRPVKVPGKAPPYDPAEEDDFAQRLAKKGATGYEGNAPRTRLWQRQGGHVRRVATPSPRKAGGMPTTQARGRKVVPTRWPTDAYHTPPGTGSFMPGTR